MSDVSVPVVTWRHQGRGPTNRLFQLETERHCQSVTVVCVDQRHIQSFGRTILHRGAWEICAVIITETPRMLQGFISDPLYHLFAGDITTSTYLHHFHWGPFLSRMQPVLTVITRAPSSSLARIPSVLFQAYTPHCITEGLRRVSALPLVLPTNLFHIMVASQALAHSIREMVEYMYKS